MTAYGKTDAGRVRPSNQDAFVCGRLSDTAVFAVVCDGMGGANGGKVASAIAVDVIANRWVDGWHVGMEDAAVRHLLEIAVDTANREIFDTAMEDEKLHGMGTTTVIALVDQDQAFIVYVGDSRAYRMNGDGLCPVTRDHSIVQEMLDKGQLTAEEARHHPRKHFLTKALGVEETVQPGFVLLPLSKDDRLLLCTDGLTNMLDSPAIEAILESQEAQAVPDALINAANMNGGNDNITVVYLTADERSEGDG